MDLRLLLIGLALATGACSPGLRPLIKIGPHAVDSACSTPEAKVSFDFEAASFSRCIVNGDREFTILVTPEHFPPINPSPWYAFRYETRHDAPLTVHLRYLGGQHRYAPSWSDGAQARNLQVELGDDGKLATMVLPAGKAIVSAQEIIGLDYYRKALGRWARGPQVDRLVIGRSHDRRKIEAIHIGRSDTPNLVVLIGRQHPPETTGAIAMEAFVDRITELVKASPDIRKRFQFLIIPVINPDGVARGNWRANLGGIDLNRDWGGFTQPETQAVKRWLDALPAGVAPVLMLDFHSTDRNLFYVQGAEAGDQDSRFLQAWLGGKENAYPGYAFTLERRNANPGSGTTKNWFHEHYGIPAYTYEAADNVDRDAARLAARALAGDLIEALDLTLEARPESGHAKN